MDQKELDELHKKIKRLKSTKTLDTKLTKGIDSFSIALDLVAGTVVGTIIGVITDRTFNSKPLFLIICLLIGILAGFKIIWQKLSSKNNDT